MEMAQWKMCLQCNHEDLSSDPHMAGHSKTQCETSALMMGSNTKEDTWYLLTNSLANQMACSSFHESAYIRKIRWRSS